jgi:histidine phosphotransferase ChpT
MTKSQKPSDLEFAALIASKICHDVIGPVGAIGNGLEILEEDDDKDSNAYALEVIRNVTNQASARLQYARFAFGAAGSAGAQIDLETARTISVGLLSSGKHTLEWRGPTGYLPKNQAKLLLNLVACAITALPRGGTIDLTIGPDLAAPLFELRCSGRAVRPPQHLGEFLAGEGEPEIDALSIQAYYTVRLAEETGMGVRITKDGDAIVLVAG